MGHLSIKRFDKVHFNINTFIILNFSKITILQISNFTLLTKIYVLKVFGKVEILKSPLKIRNHELRIHG